ncbi:MAG: DMT family transporter [Acidimicrobiales bacterium]
MHPLTYTFAVLAAAANAASSTLQRKANIDEPDSVAFTPQMILDLLRRPVWLGGIGAVIVGFLLQAAALGHGALAFVEPVLALELPFTLALASVVFHRRMHFREWSSAALLAGGVALLLVALRPSGGTPAIAAWKWGAAVAVTAGGIAVMIGWALRSSGERRAALLGVATGASFGLTAAFMSRMSEAFGGGFLSIFTVWQTYAMVVTGVAAMFLLQNALQAGTLVSVQPGLTLTDPMVSMAWGIGAFGEHVQGGLWYLGAVVAAVMILVGTVRLSHSPLIHGKAEGAGGAGGAEGAAGAGGEPGDDRPPAGRTAQEGGAGRRSQATGAAADGREVP